MDNQPNPRKTAFIILGGILALFVLTWLWRYYHTGTVVITTNSPYNTISFTEIGANGQSTGKNYKAHGKLSVTLHTGKYAASVTGNSVATVQAIDLKPRQTLRYAINPINATGVEPVTYDNAQSIAATAHQLVYFGNSSSSDDSSDAPYTIDDQNNLKKIDSDYALQKVKWADASFGIGQDDKGRLYTIAGASVRPLKVPFLYGGKTVNFDVSADKRIYVSYGKDVYGGGQHGGFKKIYTSTSSRPVLAAGGGQVAVADDRYGANASNISESLLATINASGKTHKKSVEADRLAWSPDGKYLAAVNDANPTIYDAALHVITVIPTKSTVGQLTWLNGTTLLYSLNDQLWTYDLSQQKAQLLANMPLAASVTGLFPSHDGAYIYLTTLDATSSSYAIKRIGLKGQKVPDSIYRLQDILPLGFGAYSLNFINFSGPPTIIVRVAPGTTSGPAALQAARQKLQSLGFDVSKLRFEVVQIQT
ncbi:MAG: hypothetical protein ACREJM_04275 [Candidatus Saccharimonadales bacterium]